MKLPISDRLDKIIDALSYPDDYNIDKNTLVKIQQEIDGFNNQTLDELTVGKLLLAQALVHYQNGNDKEALDFVNASINHSVNYQVAYDLLDTLNGYPSNTQQNNAGTVYEDPIGGPLKYIVNCYANYFNLSGRARRAEFWYFRFYYYGFYIFLYIIMWVGYLLFYQGINTQFNSLQSIGPIILVSVAIIFYVFNLIPLITVRVRRLHDIGLSGAWYFLLFIPIIGDITLFVMALLPSNEGDNSYGPDPKYYTE